MNPFIRKASKAMGKDPATLQVGLEFVWQKCQVVNSQHYRDVRPFGVFHAGCVNARQKSHRDDRTRRNIDQPVLFFTSLSSGFTSVFLTVSIPPIISLDCSLGSGGGGMPASEEDCAD